MITGRDLNRMRDSKTITLYPASIDWYTAEMGLIDNLPGVREEHRNGNLSLRGARWNRDQILLQEMSLRGFC